MHRIFQTAATLNSLMNTGYLPTIYTFGLGRIGGYSNTYISTHLPKLPSFFTEMKVEHSSIFPPPGMVTSCKCEHQHHGKSSKKCCQLGNWGEWWQRAIHYQATKNVRDRQRYKEKQQTMTTMTMTQSLFLYLQSHYCLVFLPHQFTSEHQEMRQTERGWKDCIPAQPPGT